MKYKTLNINQKIYLKSMCFKYFTNSLNKLLDEIFISFMIGVFYPIDYYYDKEEHLEYYNESVLSRL